MLPGILFAICGVVWAVYFNRFIRGVAANDPSVPDPIAVGFAMRAQPSKLVSMTVSTWLTYVRALGRRQEDDDLEGLRLIGLFWLALSLLAFAWLVIS